MNHDSDFVRTYLIQQLQNSGYNGFGTSQNYKKAAYWWKKSAAQENENAEFGLGRCYLLGYGVEENEDLAIKYWKRAAKQEQIEAQEALMLYYKELEKEHGEEIDWCIKLAKQGDITAQKFLGDYYYFGQGVKQDNNKAFYWYNKAAHQGHIRSQYLVGTCYENGEGVLQDYDIALQWYMEASRKGDKDAKENVEEY